eukprot:COSAG02_NODE_4027_length_5886_cov_4.820287_3_plen_109_part_00
MTAFETLRSDQFLMKGCHPGMSLPTSSCADTTNLLDTRRQMPASDTSQAARQAEADVTKLAADMELPSWWRKSRTRGWHPHCIVNVVTVQGVERVTRPHGRAPGSSVH